MKINKSKTEKVSFYSSILGRQMPMQVYLPAGYDNFTPLPVLYFLHGRSGNENIMSEAEINTAADRMINNGEIEPMIIVCPRIENSRGLNSSMTCKNVPDPIYSSRIINLGRYEDYFIEEIVPFIDKTFSTIKERKGRYIGGASAGGYAALHNALRHQDMFSRAAGHMPAMELRLEEEDKPYYPEIGSWEKYDPIYIAEHHDISSDINVYLDAGDKDEGRFYEGCAALHKILTGKGVKCQNHIFPGNHSVDYIKSNMEKYLKFYGLEMLHEDPILRQDMTND
jgi:enterochelin esterase-like enzyme